jgi:mono/diheme cytochrome c family protein
MKNFSSLTVRTISVAVMSLAFFIMVNAQTAQQWVVPAKNSSMKNPTATSKENIANGKDLYAKHCKSCHGTTGLGDGAKAASLDVPCGDFTTAKFQGETDGAIFYKITEGHGKMPSFKKNITDDNDRWMIVHYLRTFKAK